MLDKYCIKDISRFCVNKTEHEDIKCLKEYENHLSEACLHFLNKMSQCDVNLWLVITVVAILFCCCIISIIKIYRYCCKVITLQRENGNYIVYSEYENSQKEKVTPEHDIHNEYEHENEPPCYTEVVN